MTEFACTSKAVKIKKTYGTTEVYSSNYTLDEYRFCQSLKEVSSLMEKKHKQLLKTSLKANLKAHQDPKIEAVSSTFKFKTILGQIPSSLNIVKITLF